MAQQVGDSVADTLKRPAAKQVSSNQTNIQPFRGSGNGKFGGLKGGPTGGTMNTGGKRRQNRLSA